MACNPFAPAFEEGDPFLDFLGDQRTIDGFFTNFKNAYELRDISLYQPLLDSSFTFIYRDFDAAVNRQWGYSQEIESTRQLFRSADLIRLDWNQVIAQEITNSEKTATVIRSFNLTVSLEGDEVFRGSGNVNFSLTRPDSAAVWKLLVWRDESEL